jgi:ferredoxin
MTHVVTDACIRCKYTDCADICPTDCFFEGENMLVIDPGNCIDCGLCVAECPADAILPDVDADATRWLELNATYAALWPDIARRKAAPADADDHLGEADKFGKYFSAKPGSGA